MVFPRHKNFRQTQRFTINIENLFGTEMDKDFLDYNSVTLLW
jgi:hypothetical protein